MSWKVFLSVFLYMVNLVLENLTLLSSGVMTHSLLMTISTRTVGASVFCPSSELPIFSTSNLAVRSLVFSAIDFVRESRYVFSLFVAWQVAVCFPYFGEPLLDSPL